MKKSLFLILFLLAGCAGQKPQSVPSSEPVQETVTEEPVIAEAKENTEQEENTEVKEESQEMTMQLKINESVMEVEWEENESVEALRELVSDEPLTIQMSMYGGFEQVGSIGTSIVRNDVQTVTESGDIVLYSGNQIVVFYGSNSWAYTRLGHITDQTPEEMRALLGNGDVSVTISMEASE